MIIRKATIEDIDALVQLRLDFFIQRHGSLSDHETTALQEQLSGYFTRHLPDDSIIAALAETEGQIAATAFLMVTEKPAGPAFLNGKFGTLINVMTYPEFRRQGLATRVINFLLDEARRLELSVVELTATEDGKPVYEKLGFSVEKNPLMRLPLD